MILERMNRSTYCSIVAKQSNPYLSQIKLKVTRATKCVYNMTNQKYPPKLHDCIYVHNTTDGTHLYTFYEISIPSNSFGIIPLILSFNHNLNSSNQIVLTLSCVEQIYIVSNNLRLKNWY